ncbi:MAG: HAMP domain-containing sensor histidine kinase [Campylobacterota bacterium]|nr:HAMP domain-containing sensor histidine kinase [Campylobacterota bacterium]
MIQEHFELIDRRLTKFTVVSVICLVFMALFHIAYENYMMSAVLIFISIILSLNAITTFSLHVKVFIMLCAGALLHIFLLYSGDTGQSGWLWILLYPPVAFLLNNKRNGLIWTLLLGFVILTIFLLQYFHYFISAYSEYQLFKLMLAYAVSACLMYSFQSEVDLYTHKLETLNKSLEEQIKSEVEKNKRKDTILSTQAKHAQMGEMLSMIAHQWRQPLNAISANAIKMKLENDMNMLTGDKINESSEFIQEKAQNLSEIINSFLKLSKPSSGDSEFILEHSISKALKMASTQLALSYISLHVEYQGESKSRVISGSEVFFEQVFLNLLMNIEDAYSEQANSEEKSISIIVDAFANIKVIDRAGGVEPLIENRIFNPYFTTKEEGKGTGLGLYMSRKIMRSEFKGDLTYSSVENGSCFEIVFDRESEKELSDV